MEAPADSGISCRIFRGFLLGSLLVLRGVLRSWRRCVDAEATRDDGDHPLSHCYWFDERHFRLCVPYQGKPCKCGQIVLLLLLLLLLV